MRTLVLNASFEPLQHVCWKRAFTLIFARKAEMISEHEGLVRTVNTAYRKPSVIRLLDYVHIKHHYGLANCSRKNILLRDQYTCQYCGVSIGKHNATIDHVVPRKHGGKSNWTNLVASCSPCNRKKGSKNLSRSGLRLKRAPFQPTRLELMKSEEPGLISI